MGWGRKREGGKGEEIEGGGGRGKGDKMEGERGGKGEKIEGGGLSFSIKILILRDKFYF